jgi:hypothetical protein
MGRFQVRAVGRVTQVIRSLAQSQPLGQTYWTIGQPLSHQACETGT